MVTSELRQQDAAEERIAADVRQRLGHRHAGEVGAHTERIALQRDDGFEIRRLQIAGTVERAVPHGFYGFGKGQRSLFTGDGVGHRFAMHDQADAIHDVQPEHCRKGRAIQERIVFHMVQLLPERDRFKTVAFGECILPDACDRIQVHHRQGAASKERAFAQFGNIGNECGFQRRAVGERVIPYLHIADQVQRDQMIAFAQRIGLHGDYSIRLIFEFCLSRYLDVLLCIAVEPYHGDGSGSGF